MPPEQASGSGQVDRRSDIYSLACVLYETLAGQPPFTGPTAQAIMARHSVEAGPRFKIVRDAIPDELEVVIERALEKVPADRYQTSGESAKALTAASTGRVSRVTVGRRRSSYFVRKRRLLSIALGAVVLVAAAWLILGKRGSATSASGALDPRRVAVLYFGDLSPDSSLRYLADGLTEALIDKLSQVRTLHVISRNGVLPFRHSDLPRDSIARAVGAGTLVEGSVDPVRDRVRVTVRLVDGSSGADLLRRASFEEPVGNLLLIRDTLATEVARVLREQLGEEVRLREERAGTSSTEAWSLAQQSEPGRKHADVLVQPNDLRGAALAARRAYEEDAYLGNAPDILYRLFFTSYDLDQQRQAQRWCEEGDRRFPRDFRFLECQLYMMTRLEQPDVPRAWRLLAGIDSLVPAPRRGVIHLREQMMVAATIARAGLKDSAHAVIERSRGTPELDPEQDLVAMEAFVRTLLGEQDEAIRLLQRYVAANPEHSFRVGGDIFWWWWDLQKHPGFQALARPHS